MNTLQPLVRQILDIAMQIALLDGPSVAVGYTSIANQLRITASRQWTGPTLIEECIELCGTSESEFVKRRVQRRLQEVITQLNALLLSCTIPPRGAA